MIKQDFKGKKVIPEICEICKKSFFENYENKINQEHLLCDTCLKIENAPQILDSRHEENWRGLVSKENEKKKRTISGKTS